MLHHLFERSQILQTMDRPVPVELVGNGASSMGNDQLQIGKIVVNPGSAKLDHGGVVLVRVV